MARELARKSEHGVAQRQETSDPFREMLGLRDTITGLFDDFFTGRPLMAGIPVMTSRSESWTPPVSIRETDQELRVYAALPGVSKEDCTLEIRDNTLILSGRCPELSKDDEHWLRQEIPSGAFYRAFNLPPEVKSDEVKANYDKGILEIHIPKSEEARPMKVDIQ